MKQTITVVLLFVGMLFTVGMGGVQAQSSPEITCDGKTSEIQIGEVVKIYNNNTDAVPSVIQSAVTSNTTELRIDNANQVHYTIDTDGSLKATSVSVGEASNPDVIVQTDRDTACSLYTSQTPVKTFETAYANDEIEITANGTVNSAKVYIVDKVVKALSLF